MFSKVLIANRGEIALRVIRACRDLNIRSVAVFSEADRNMRYVSEADDAVHIGPSSPKESYLAIERIIDAARQTGVDAIHPGYGFLSENAKFARCVEEAGLVFIGPPSSVIEDMGSKISTRRLMTQSNIPVLPGCDAPRNLDEAVRQAGELGYPVLVKPSGGGGGRGGAPSCRTEHRRREVGGQAAAGTRRGGRRRAFGIRAKS